MNIPLLLMIPLLCGGIYIIATLLRLNFPSIKKHTSLHFSWECTNIVSYGRLYFEKNKKKKKTTLKKKRKKTNCAQRSTKPVSFSLTPFCSLCRIIIISHNIFCWDRNLQRVFLCSGEWGRLRGRLRTRTRIRKGSQEIIVWRLCQWWQASENIRVAFGDKNRYTTLSCPQSNHALICSKMSIDAADGAFSQPVMTACGALWMWE